MRKKIGQPINFRNQQSYQTEHSQVNSNSFFLSEMKVSLCRVYSVSSSH